MILFLAVVLCGLLFMSAFCSAVETSFFSLASFTVKTYHNSENPRLQLISRLLDHPRDLLVTILILNVFANLLVQNVISSLFAPSSYIVFKVGFPLFLTLILGELLPKSIAMSHNAAVAYRTAPAIEWCTQVLSPLRNVFTKIVNWVSRFFFFFLAKEKEISAEELHHVLKQSEKSGVLLAQECRLMEGALGLQSSLVKEKMRPREEILFYDIHDPLEKLIYLFVDLATTRVPVCDGTLDNLLGVLSTRRFFFHQKLIQNPADIVPIVKKPYYVPESTKAWVLLKNLRESGESLAMVIDEYGSISGLITQEDLIEAVVGEIADKRDVMSLYTQSSNDAIIASGKLELSAFRDIFGIPLQSKEGVVTLGGWLIEQFGDIPQTGTKYANDDFLFYILAADPNRIQRVYVRKIAGKKK